MSPVDLTQFGPRIELPDRSAREAARRRLAVLTGPGHAWLAGPDRFEELAAWLAGAQGRYPTLRIQRPRLLVFAGDHGVASAGVSAHPPGWTLDSIRTAATGGGPVRAVADSVDVAVRLIDMAVDGDLVDVLPPADVQYKIRRGSGRIDETGAVSRDEAERAFLAGVAIADAEVDAGADLLLAALVGVGASTHAAVLTGVLTRTDAAAVTGRGSGIDDAVWIRKCAIVRDALRRARPVLADQLELLAVAGGADFAALTGFLVQSAVRRTPVVLDGLPAAACGLVGQRLAYRCVEWWLAGPRTPDHAHQRALDRLRLVDAGAEDHRLGPGVGALLAVPLIRAAVDLLAQSPEADLTAQPAEQP